MYVAHLEHNHSTLTFSSESSSRRSGARDHAARALLPLHVAGIFERRPSRGTQAGYRPELWGKYSSTKNESALDPALLAEAKEALHRLGNPDFDFDDMYRPREDEIEQLRALGGGLDDYLQYEEAESERLTARLAARLDDSLREAIERAEQLRENAERMLEYTKEVSKSVASTALLEDARAGRHHIAELLRGPLSDEALHNLCREVPSPPDLMSDTAFAYYVFRWSVATFEKVLPLVNGKEPAEAIAIVRKYNPRVAEWIEDMDPGKKQPFLLSLTGRAIAAKKKPITRHRFLALRLGGSIVGMDWSTFENRVVNRREPKEPTPKPRRR